MRLCSSCRIPYPPHHADCCSCPSPHCPTPTPTACLPPSAAAGSWVYLAVGASSLAATLWAMVLGSGAVALSDVVVDSMVVEKAREEEQVGGGGWRAGGGAGGDGCVSRRVFLGGGHGKGGVVSW